MIFEVSEDTVTQALIDARGDLVVASGLLAVPPSKLVQYIRAVPSIAATWQELEAVKSTPEFDGASQRWFESEMRNRLAAYRFEGLEVIHELATMPHGESSSMAEVRLKAAVHLRGAADGMSSDAGNVLAELNAIYQANAPRMKSIRAVQIEFERD